MMHILCCVVNHLVFACTVGKEWHYIYLFCYDILCCATDKDENQQTCFQWGPRDTGVAGRGCVEGVLRCHINTIHETTLYHILSHRSVYYRPYHSMHILSRVTSHIIC